MENLELVPSNSRHNTSIRFFKSDGAATRRQHVAASESAILNSPTSLVEKSNAISGRQQRRAGKYRWFSEAWFVDEAGETRFFQPPQHAQARLSPQGSF